MEIHNGREDAPCFEFDENGEPQILAGTPEAWYPDRSSVFEDGVCVYGPVPRGIPFYGFQLDCCNGSYSQQEGGKSRDTCTL